MIKRVVFMIAIIMFGVWIPNDLVLAEEKIDRVHRKDGAILECKLIGIRDNDVIIEPKGPVAFLVLNKNKIERIELASCEILTSPLPERYGYFTRHTLLGLEAIRFIPDFSIDNIIYQKGVKNHYVMDGLNPDTGFAIGRYEHSEAKGWSSRFLFRFAQAGGKIDWDASKEMLNVKLRSINLMPITAYLFPGKRIKPIVYGGIDLSYSRLIVFLPTTDRKEGGSFDLGCVYGIEVVIYPKKVMRSLGIAFGLRGYYIFTPTEYKVSEDITYKARYKTPFEIYIRIAGSGE